MPLAWFSAKLSGFPGGSIYIQQASNKGLSASTCTDTPHNKLRKTADIDIVLMVFVSFIQKVSKPTDNAPLHKKWYLVHSAPFQRLTDAYQNLKISDEMQLGITLRWQQIWFKSLHTNPTKKKNKMHSGTVPVGNFNNIFPICKYIP